MPFQTLISPADAAAGLNQPDFVFIDCRFSLPEPDEGRALYTESHIPGAVYAHLDNDLAGPVTPESGRHPLPAPNVMAARFGGWGIGNQTQVVVYDAGPGAYAARCWWLLRWLGHANAAVLDGGLAAWNEAGLPLSSEPPTPAAATFHATPNDDLLITADQLRRDLEERQVLLLDARAAERFRGEVEPIDPVAGHVPGAVNAPFAENSDGAGKMAPSGALQERFRLLAGGQPEGQVVHMCGSGVTACHNALAMAHCGLPMGRLYAGSWSEWIRDPSRPTCTGA